jgi:hypothetical protein
MCYNIKRPDGVDDNSSDNSTAAQHETASLDTVSELRRASEQPAAFSEEAASPQVLARLACAVSVQRHP